MKDNEYIENKEPEKGEVDEKPKNTSSRGKVKSNAFNQILNGEFLTKDFVINNLNYIFYIFFLLLILFAKG